MSISQMFQDFLSNIKVANEEQITLRYQEITGALNKNFVIPNQKHQINYKLVRMVDGLRLKVFQI